jgi:Domain of unknown function (DUF4185)
MGNSGRQLGGAGLVACVAFACAPAGPELDAERWPVADALFTGDPSFIGGDGAYSVDLGNERVLWLFGDSFIATTRERRRDHSWMVRNCVAVQTGYDPSRAFMRFYYRWDERRPQSFFPEVGAEWYWPGAGVRLGELLILFGGRVYQAEEGMWGFRPVASAAFLVRDPDDEPSAWSLEETPLPSEGADVQMGGAIVVTDRYLYDFGIEGDRHDIYLARFELEAARRGELAHADWWTGDGFGAGRDREPVVEIGAPEYSVHFAKPLGMYLMVQSSGAGATTLAVRSAPEPWGPWSEPRDILRAPESFEKEAFVYAGKAHPELSGADLLATYVPSTNEGGPIDVEETLYYPRFVRIEYP